MVASGEGKTVGRRARTIVLVAVGAASVTILGLEVAYRVTLSGVAPLTALEHRLPLPRQVSRAIWAAEGGRGEPHVPRLYPWRIGSIFRKSAGVRIASAVARGLISPALERGQVRGMLQWHLKWLAVTVWVTRQLSSEEVLATYADELWLGSPQRGLENGAIRYFGKHVGELDASETALLLGVARNPKSNDPAQHPDRATAARDDVLRRFCEAGYISEQQLTEAVAQPIRIVKGRGNQETS